MAVEHLVKRTIYVAECSCGEKYILEDHPPKEKRCKCKKWVTFEKKEWIGKDFQKSN